MKLPKRDDWEVPARGKRKEPKQVAGTSIEPRDWWHGCVTIGYNTGERKGALLHVEQPPPGATTIRFPSGIRKGHRKARVVPLNAAAQREIERIRTDRRQLLPFPHAERDWYTLWWQLLKTAGIPEDRWFGLHGLRKATLSEASSYSPMGAQQIAGHSDGTLLEKHYVTRRLMKDALDRLPQP